MQLRCRYPCVQVWQTDFSQVSPTLLATALLQLQQTDLYHFNPDVLFPLMDQGPTRLKYLPILELELVGVEPDTFARACVKLETVELSNLCEQSRHVAALLGLLATGKTRVRKLLTARTDLGEVEVEPEVLAKAVIGLEVATLDSLSSPQLGRWRRSSGSPQRAPGCGRSPSTPATSPPSPRASSAAAWPT